LIPTPAKPAPTPTNKTTLGKLEDDDLSSRVDLGGSPALATPALPTAIAAKTITVRMRCQGVNPKKFKTTRSLRAIENAIVDAFTSIGLDVDKRGNIQGRIWHSYGFVYEFCVTGSAWMGKKEIIVDLSISSSISWWTILISLFFPLWLFVVLWVVVFTGRQDGARYLDNAFEEVCQELADE
jgi:hypothetical protein